MSHDAASEFGVGNVEGQMGHNQLALRANITRTFRLDSFNSPNLSRLIKWSIGLLSIYMLAQLVQVKVIHRLEQLAFEIKPNGSQTPGEYGAPFKDIPINLAGRQLHARVVLSAIKTAPALLIFHGNGEAISDWAAVQARLWKLGVSTMVFDYSGFGDSTGEPTVEAMREDASSAYKTFLGLVPLNAPKFVMGHSLGNAVMLDVLKDLMPKPSGVIVHAGFSSARDFVIHAGLASKFVADLLPDLWDNEKALSEVQQPILVMHSDADEVIPLDMGKKLGRAVGLRGTFHVIPKVFHDQIFLHPTDQEWNPILGFIASPMSKENVSARTAVLN